MRYLILFCFLSFVACGPKIDNPEVQRLYDKVLVIHDDVMPEMSTIHRLRKKLKAYKEADSIALNLITDLDNADNAMMDWMADFGAFRDMENEEKSVKLKYLNEELLKIQDVDKVMRNSIKEAQDYLASQNDE